MRPLLLLLSVALPTVLNPPMTAAGQPTLGSVRAILHGLTIQPPHLRPAPGWVHQQLFSSYRLTTGAHQRASLGFVDGSVVEMNQLTDVLLGSAQVTRLTAGEIAVFIKPGSPRRVRTANAVVGAIGTIFDVSIAAPRARFLSVGAATAARRFPRGTTTVSVTRGTVVVSNRFGSVTVTQGHWTHVPPGRAPLAPTRHQARLDVRWTRTLPPAGVG